MDMVDKGQLFTSAIMLRPIHKSLDRATRGANLVLRDRLVRMQRQRRLRPIGELPRVSGCQVTELFANQ